MILRILQLKEENLEKYGFMSYSFAKKHDFNLNDYECVWEENIDCDTNLDEIFVRFNVNHPDEYEGRSLSVSDIIELEGNLYYCDRCGWVELEEKWVD